MSRCFVNMYRSAKRVPWIIFTFRQFLMVSKATVLCYKYFQYNLLIMLTISLSAADRSLGTPSSFYKMPLYSPYKNSMESQQQNQLLKNEKDGIMNDPVSSFIRILTDPHSLLGEKIPKVIFDVSITAPSPSRDYCQLVIVKPNLKGHVCFNISIFLCVYLYNIVRLLSRQKSTAH